eukprot:jgi/Astpho2/7913/Aster-06391
MLAIRTLLLAGACAGLSRRLPRVAEGLVGAATSTLGGLTGIGGRHLLGSPPSPVTSQLMGAVTGAGNTGVGGVSQGLQTLGLVPQPTMRHLLQATAAPATGDAQLVDTVQNAVKSNAGSVVGAATSTTGALSPSGDPADRCCHRHRQHTAERRGGRVADSTTGALAPTR